MAELLDRFQAEQYMIRRKIFTLIGAAFHVYDPQDQLLLYSRQKGFKLKEDVRLYADESMTDEILRISARNVIDFSAAYDVHDSQSNALLGTLRRRGFKSMLRDEWEIADEDGHAVATIREDSTAAALVRRFIEAASFLMPQQFHVEVDGRTIGTFKQNFNPFVHKLNADFSRDGEGTFDRRLGVAAGVLLIAIEGRQG